MIIGITGTIGSGKGTVVKVLKDKGFSHYSVSQILKDILNERSLPAIRTNLSPLSNELSAKYPGGALYLAHERAQKDGAKNYVLESIHRVSEADYVRSIGGKIVGIDADIEKRFERARRRQEGEKDNVTFEQFCADSKREDEGADESGPNIRAVMKMADTVLTNNGTQEELFAQIEEVLRKISKKI